MQDLFSTTFLLTIFAASIVAQGVFEAFPISSSMHIMLADKYASIFSFTMLAKEIMHLGSGLAFFAICFPFIKRILRDLWTHFFNSRNREIIKKDSIYSTCTSLKLVKKFIIITIPTIIIGYLIKDIALTKHELYFNLFAATMLIIIDRKMQRRNSIISICYKSCAIIGLLICLALLPGFSRLGFTYTIFRLFHFRRFDALFCTILVGIPITLGAAFIGIINHFHNPLILLFIAASLLAGIVTYLIIPLTFLSLNYWWIYGVYRIALSAWLLLMK